MMKGKKKDKILNVHHIESRKTGGDSPDNLLTLCETCHHDLHKQGLEHLFKRNQSIITGCFPHDRDALVYLQRIKRTVPLCSIHLWILGPSILALSHGLAKGTLQ